MDLEGKTLGNYHLIEKVGRGGMSTVYKAHDLANDRAVAVKVLAPALARDPSFRTRFRREASILIGLRHRHIIPILDFGEHEGLAFLVMPFVRLGGLHHRLEQGDLSPKEGARIISQVASALQHAHNAGIVHRDVKPSNILLDGDGNAWLSDFGFAHVRDATLNLTGSAIIGTPAYMPPEQIRGDAVTPQSDQYALAVVLYQMATGKLPFDAETPMAIAIKHATEPLPRPRLVNPNLPDVLEAVLLKSLAKDPQARFGSVAAFAEAFRKAMRSAYDPATGQLRAGAVTPLPVTAELPAEVVPGSQDRSPATRSRRLTTRRLVFAALLLVLLCPTSFLFARAYSRGDVARWINIAMANPTPDIQATVQAVIAANLPAEGTQFAPGELEAIVAASLTALAPPDEAEPQLVSIAWTPEGTPQLPGDTSSGEPSDTPLPGGGPDAPSASATNLSVIPSGGASETPVPTAVPSITSANTSTPSATTPATPSVTFTLPPTATVTLPPTSPPPTATVAPCASISLGGFAIQGQNASWSLTNNNPLTITISGVYLEWNPVNQRLDQIRVGGNLIWEGADEESPTNASDGGAVGSGSSKGISFTFKRAAAGSGYFLRVSLSNGCQFTASK